MKTLLCLLIAFSYYLGISLCSFLDVVANYCCEIWVFATVYSKRDVRKPLQVNLGPKPSEKLSENFKF